MARPLELPRVELDHDLPERQLDRERRDLDVVAVDAGQGPGETPVVEIGRGPEIGIQLVRAVGRGLGEQEREGIDGGGEEVPGLLRLLGVEERQLGEGEDLGRRARAREGPVEGRERLDGLVVPAVDEVVPPENVERGGAGLAARERVPGQELVDDPGVDPGHPDGCGAAREDRQEEDRPEPGPARVDARPGARESHGHRPATPRRGPSVGRWCPGGRRPSSRPGPVPAAPARARKGPGRELVP